MGQEWYGISAGYGELGFTLRTWETPVMKELQKSVDTVVQRIAESNKLKIEQRYFEEFNSIINEEECANQIENAASSNGLSFHQMTYPMNWGEDYGLFTSLYKGAMFGLGAGTAMPALHNPDYDFPDEIAESGIKMFVDLIRQNDLYD